MPYLGKTPSQGVRARYQFTPDAGATSVSGADANGSTMTFTDGNYVDVYLNGVMLKAGTDYNTNTANTIASLVATVASDVVDVIVYDTFSLFGGTLEGNVTVNNGTFNVTGATDLDSTLNVDGSLTGTTARFSGNTTIGGSTVTDSNMLNIQGNGSSVNVGAVFNKTNSTAQIWSTQVRNSDNAFLIHNYTASSTPLVISTAGAATFGGVVTANAGVVVDEMTIDGDTITATDDFIIDAVGDIELNADGNEITFKHGSDLRYEFKLDSTPEMNVTGGNFTIQNQTDDGDILFKGSDDGAGVTALTLDMSEAGDAQFNRNVGIGGTPNNYSGYSALTLNHATNGGVIDLELNGTLKGEIFLTSSALNIKSIASNEDILFQGNDGGSAITALTLDMSEAGAATFNSTVTSSGYTATSSGSGTVDGLVITNSDTANNGLSIGVDSSENAFIWNGSNTQLRFATNNGQKMTLDANGNLLVGKTAAGFANVGTELAQSGFAFFTRDGGAPVQINRKSSDGAIAEFYKDGSAMGIIGSDGGSLAIGGGDVGIGFYQLADAIVPYNNVTALRDSAIDLGLASSGRWKDLHASGTGYFGKVGIGTTSIDGSNKLQVEETTANTAVGIKIQSASWDAILTLTTGSNSWEIGNDYSNSASLNFYNTQTSSVAMMLDSSSNVLIGRASVGNTGNGHSIRGGDSAIFSRDAGGESVQIGRNAADGQLIQFRDNGTEVGDIREDGGTVSLTGFAGNHESSGISESTETGTVVSTIDELDTRKLADGSTVDHKNHAKIKVSDSVGDKRVYGVLNKFVEHSSGLTKALVTSVGISSVKVTGACEGGDLLESNGDGTAKVQSDDIIRSKTIGKVTIGNNTTSVKLVSCVLYCG